MAKKNKDNPAKDSANSQDSVPNLPAIGKKNKRTLSKTGSKKNTPVGKKGYKHENMGKKIHDWDRIRTLYVEGVPDDVSKPDGSRSWLTIRELAERENVKEQLIRAQSAKYRWTALKAEYQGKLTLQRQRDRAKKLSGEAVDFDDQALSIGKFGLRLVNARMMEIAKEVQDKQPLRELAVKQRAAGMPVDWDMYKSAIYHRELEALAGAADRFQQIGMKAMGTDVNRHEITGRDGEPIEIDQTVSVRRELERDDAGRLSGFLAVAGRAGILEEALKAFNDPDGDVIEGEVIDDAELPEPEYEEESEQSDDSE